jgi:hypothetical protein
MNWLVRMSMLARRPPPLWKVKLVIGVIVICLVIFGVENIWGWPDFLSVNGRFRHKLP